MLLNASVLNSVVLNGDAGSSGDGETGGTGTSIGRFVASGDISRMLDGTQYAVFARVRIAGPDGVLIDYSRRNNIDWIQSVEISATIDEPIATATVKLLREQGSKSLAPFRTASSYNQLPFVESDLSHGTGPSLDAGRRILIDLASVDVGTDPFAIADSDWHLSFEGTIDSVDWAQAVIVIECRDKGAALQDTWFPVPNVINAASLSLDTVNIQQAIAALLDLGHLDQVVPLYVPTAPDPEVLVGSFRYDIEPVMDSLQRVATINGWDLRYRFADLYQEYRLTYKDPGRTRTDVDFILEPRSYIDVKAIKLDRSTTRNDISVTFGPDTDHLTTINEYSPESVSQYGRRSMILTEASDSAIQDDAAARLMAQLILFDLGTALLTAQIDMFTFWPIELFNRVRFPANLVHSDVPLDLTVSAYRHQIYADGKSRTLVDFRDKAALSYWTWFLRKPVVGGTGIVPDGPSSSAGFGSLSQLPDYTADTVQFDWVYSGDPTATFDIYVQRGTGGFVPEATGLSSMTHLYDVGIDIEPFHTPPDPPQIPVIVSYFIQAVVSGAVIATSPTSVASYGFGP